MAKEKNLDSRCLCFVSGNIMYFTDNFKRQWGDDWDDAPYEHNADPPYERSDDLPDKLNEDRGNITIAAWFDPEYRVGLPCDGSVNSEYSVASINAGAIPWLSIYNEKGLMGGATIAEAREWCKKHGVLFAVFEETRHVS